MKSSFFKYSIRSMLCWIPVLAWSDERPKLSYSGIQFQKIKAGSFMFGARSWFGETERERNGSLVEVPYDFAIGVTEITQNQWANVYGSYLHESMEEMGISFPHVGPNLPVSRVNYFDACKFCVMLTKKERKAGTISENQFFRLPTEIEWEYAARAGKNSLFFCGELINSDFANLGFGPEPKIKGRDLPSSTIDRPLESCVWEVTKMKENSWGIYGMSGNVSEWCFDFYKADIEKSKIAAKTQFGIQDLGALKVVVKGGHFKSAPWCGASFFRYGVSPGDRELTVGFRIVLVES